MLMGGTARARIKRSSRFTDKIDCFLKLAKMFLALLEFAGPITGPNAALFFNWR